MWRRQVLKKSQTHTTMCDNTRLMTLTNQALGACQRDVQCIQGVETAASTLVAQGCQEPLLSRCQALNPYGAQDKGYVYGCQGVTRDVLQSTPPGAATCNPQIINQVYQNWGSQKCAAGGRDVSHGECLFGVSAGINAVLEKSSCSPYHAACDAVGSVNGFTSCNNVMRSYLYGAPENRQ